MVLNLRRWAVFYTPTFKQFVCARSLVGITSVCTFGIGLSPVAALGQQYSFPVPVEFDDRVDLSTTTFPWIRMGSGSQEVPRTAQTQGCAGVYPDGAPARVSCTNPTSVIGPQYICGPVQRQTHVGDVVLGHINIATTSTGMSDGHNVDGCTEPYVGSTEARTAFNRFQLAGGRWACPTGLAAFDVDADGNKFGDDAFPYLYNPEACAVQYCPEGSALSHSPGDPNASYHYGNPGYICAGFNEQKQPCDCEDKSPQAGDPVVIATGNSTQTEEDFTTTKPTGLAIRRYYNTRGRAKVSGALSNGWSHEYEIRILGSQPRLDYTNTVTNTPVMVMRASGETTLFTSSGTHIQESGQHKAIWESEQDNQSEVLEQLLDENLTHVGWWYHTKRNTIERYDTFGKLTEIAYSTGQTTTLEYEVTIANGGDGDSETLDRVSDYSGQFITLQYNSQDKLIGFTDPDGNAYQYEYDAAGNLSRVIYPDSTPGSLTDNPDRIYHYEDTRYPDFLTGITDEKDVKYVTWTFDSNRRVISNQFAGNVGRHDWVYGASDVTMTAPLGQQSQFTFTNLFGVKSLLNRSRNAAGNIPAALQQTGYDSFGNVNTKTD